MKETLISFCIVNLNAKSHLISCLKSISMFTKCGSFEIIVVDGGSNDASVERVKELQNHHKNSMVTLFFYLHNLEQVLFPNYKQ